jgi:hypothetical protein
MQLSVNKWLVKQEDQQLVVDKPLLELEAGSGPQNSSLEPVSNIQSQMTLQN